MVVKTTDFERRCVRPEGLQTAIDALVASKPSGRSFVRSAETLSFTWKKYGV